MKAHAARLHGRIAVSAAARHFIDRFFPGDYKVIPNGVDIPRFAGAVPLARWQDGTPNVLFVGRHEPRKGLLDLLKAHRILRRTGLREPAAGRRLGAAGARGAPLCRDARAAGRRIPRPRDRCREGPALPDRRRLRVAGDRRRIVRDRAARGDGGRRPDRRLGHPRLQGRRPARSRGSARPAARAEGAGVGAIARLLDDPELRASMSEAGRAASGAVQLAAGDGQGRRLLRLRHPPARRDRPAARGLPLAGASGAAGPGEAIRILGRPPPAASLSASVSLHAHAE